MYKYLNKILPIIIICGLFLNLSLFVFAYENPEESFSDFDDDYVYSDAINYLHEKAIVEGFEDGTFRPKDKISRAEFMKILIEAKFTDEQIRNCSSRDFIDIHEDAWYLNYLCLASENGIINGYPDGTFKPSQNINLVESSKIISLLFNLEIVSNSTVWYEQYINSLANRMAIPTSIKTLDSELSRGEMAEIVYRLDANVRFKDSKNLRSFVGLQSIQSQIDNIISNNSNKIQKVDFHMIDENGNYLVGSDFGLAENELLQPASTLKLYTTALALDRLGEDFDIISSLYSTAEIDENGDIDGDLIIYGRGDFEFRKEDLERFAEDLKVKGVKSIKGNIIGDASYLNPPKIGDGWASVDLDYYYGAPITALVINDNSLDIKISPSNLNDNANITFSIEDSYFKIINNVKTVSYGTYVDFRRNIEENHMEIVLDGQVGLGSYGDSLDLAIDNPPLVAAALFKQILEKESISVEGQVDFTYENRTNFKDLNLLTYKTSNPLKDLVKSVNKPSNNLGSEILLRLVGRDLKEKSSDTENLSDVEYGLSAMEDYLSTLELAYQFDIYDGSGLSEKDFVTSQGTANLLRKLQKQSYAEVFFDSLPIAGVDGGLARRFTNTSAKNRIIAKIGGLEHYTSLAGYLIGKDLKKNYFSIIVYYEDRNVSGNKTVIDPIMNLLAENL